MILVLKVTILYYGRPRSCLKYICTVTYFKSFNVFFYVFRCH